MSSEGGKYAEQFGRLFEGHVRSEVDSTGIPVLHEEDLQKLVPRATKVPDALLCFSSANVFIESKSGLFDESLMVVSEPAILRDKTKGLRAAIRQGWAAASAIHNNPATPAALRTAVVNHLLIVTNRELMLGTGARLRRMYPVGALDYPDEQTEILLPLEHVYILSIDDFERLIAAVRLNNLNLPEFITQCVNSDRSPATGKLLMEQHLSSAKVPHGRSSMIDNAIELASNRLEGALPG
jgi:hypothetical protein